MVERPCLPLGTGQKLVCCKVQGGCRKFQRGNSKMAPPLLNRARASKEVKEGQKHVQLLLSNTCLRRERVRGYIYIYMTITCKATRLTTLHPTILPN